MDWRILGVATVGGTHALGRYFGRHIDTGLVGLGEIMSRLYATIGYIRYHEYEVANVSRHGWWAVPL